jgi:DNA-binding LacI/PurR family transcriptional regulator
MPTITDVAREAGVGLGTASRALNGTNGIAEATRMRVLAAAERLGYQRSPIARAFSRRRTGTIEIIVPTFTRFFYVQILRGISEALADTDYSILIRAIDHVEMRDRVFGACGVRGRADGALFISIAPTEELAERLSRDAFPTVLIDAEDPRFSSVSVDHAWGMAAAVRHCIRLGHQRIALVDRHQDPFATEYPTARQRGYRAALAEAGLELRSDYEAIADFTMLDGETAATALLGLDPPPTAVLTGSDVHALGILHLARKMNLRIREELSVVGYNDIDLAAYLGLTTVRVPMRQMGYEAALMLVGEIDEPSTTRRTVRLDTELVVRETCGPRAEGVGPDNR